MGKKLLCLVLVLLSLSLELRADDTYVEKTDVGAEFLSVLGDGVVHKSPFNPAERNWDEETPINAEIIPVAERRVIGGHHGESKDFPYYVLMSLGNQKQWCGGTILTHFTIVTAAHCFFRKYKRFDISNLKITAGESNLHKSDGTEVIRKVKDVIIHENYNPHQSYYDVALIILTKSLYYNENVDTMVIANSTSNSTGIATVAGFGYTKQKRSTESSIRAYYGHTLKYAHTTIVTKEKCVEIYQRVSNPTIANIVNHKTLMCAIGEEREGVTDDACQGDSGGPLICKDSNEMAYLCGIVATGIGCGLKDHPGIYTNVSVVSDWINDHIVDAASGASRPGLGSKSGVGITDEPAGQEEVESARADRNKKQQQPTSTSSLPQFCSVIMLSKFLLGTVLYNWHSHLYC